MQAVGYVRVSTDEQAGHGLSMEDQEVRIRAWCRDNGYDLPKENLYQDGDDKNGASAGRADNRPEFLAAKAKACKLAKTYKKRCPLVTTEVERLTRNLKDGAELAEEVLKAGAWLVTLDSPFDLADPCGELMYTVRLGTAVYMRRQTSARCRRTAERLRSLGQRCGFVPFGWDVGSGTCRHKDGQGVSLVPNPQEQRALTTIRRLRGQRWSLGRIARHLQATGVPTKKPGARWHASTVRSAIRHSALRENAA